MEQGLTEQQRKWFAAVRAGLEAKTGRPLSQWVEIARGCPETKRRARLAWFKERHGIGQNHASIILNELADGELAMWSEPDALRAALWRDPRAAAILAALEAAVAALPGVVVGQRKGYTAWSRARQFAAARPGRGETVRLGLAVAPDADPRLQSAAREGWSERLTATVALGAPDEVDTGLRALLRAAHERS